MRALIIAGAAMVPGARAHATPEALVLGEVAIGQEAGALQLSAAPAWRSGAAWTMAGEIEYGLTDDVQVALEGARALETAPVPWELEGSAQATVLRGRRWRLIARGGLGVEDEGDGAALTIAPMLAGAATSGRWGFNVAVVAALPPARPDDVEVTLSLAVYGTRGRVAPVLEAATVAGRDAGALRCGAGVAVALEPLAITAGIYRDLLADELAGRVVLSWDLELASDRER